MWRHKKKEEADEGSKDKRSIMRKHKEIIMPKYSGVFLEPLGNNESNPFNKEDNQLEAENERLREQLKEACIMAISRGRYINQETKTAGCEIERYKEWLTALEA